jgi:hypothetical protein
MSLIRVNNVNSVNHAGSRNLATQQLSSHLKHIKKDHIMSTCLSPDPSRIRSPPSAMSSDDIRRNRAPDQAPGSPPAPARIGE